MELQLKLGASAIRTFRLRGVGQNHLSERLGALARGLGLAFLNQVLASPVNDVARATEICERGSLLLELSPVPGFSKVARDIIAAPDASLVKPEGAWFQLLIAGTLQRRSAIVQLEQCVDNSAPKDILMPQQKAQVECKAFRRSAAHEAIWRYHAESFERLEGHLPSGNWKLELRFEWADQALRSKAIIDLVACIEAKSFESTFAGDLFSLSPSDHTAELTGSWPENGKMIVFGSTECMDLPRIPFSLCTNPRGSLLIEGPHVDDFRRVYSAVVEKRCQMLPGWINIIALDASELGGDVQGFRDRLLQIVEQQRMPEISGFLVVQATRIQAYTSVRMELTENPFACERILPAVREELHGEVFWM